MIFRLSLALGIPAGELGERITGDELRDYEAYYALEPWGCQADDVRTAIVAHTVAACLGGGKSKFKDFVPKWDAAPETLDRKTLMAWAAQQR